MRRSNENGRPNRPPVPGYPREAQTSARERTRSLPTPQFSPHTKPSHQHDASPAPHQQHNRSDQTTLLIANSDFMFSS